MDHDEVLEQLELAAVEPDGLARLVAGDTPIAAAVAGHLAGCDACAGEFQRLGRAAPLLRDMVRTTAPADLRARTLAYVREHGEPRGEAAAAPRHEGAPEPRPAPAPVPAPALVPAPAPVAMARAPLTRLLPWVASLAAAVVLVVAATSFLTAQQATERLAQQERAIEGLESVASATLEITAQADVQRVTLAATDTDTSGSLLFSPSSTKLVVVAIGLERPPAGHEYRCWLERAGQRENVGRMFFADDLAYWVGNVAAIRDAGPGTTFGVSLADLQGTFIDAPPVITGQL
jgi:hypothetical protein